MELTDNPQQADVVVLYFLNLGKALLIDKRRSGPEGPIIRVLPQEEMLLEGKEVEMPLDSDLVYLIERRQILPQEPRVFQSYIAQLVAELERKLTLLRPGVRPPAYLSLGPHFAPVLLMVGSDLWKSLLRDLQARGENEAVTQVRDRLSELFAWETLLPELIDTGQVEALRRDFFKQEVFRLYRI